MRIHSSALWLAVVLVALLICAFFFAVNKSERGIIGLVALNDVPIVFYGKLEDQFSNAVPNTTVNFSVRVYNGFQSTVKRGNTASDANGFFTISGYKGESLSVVPENKDYVLASRNGGGIYSYMWPEDQRAHPDVNNPVVIRMWKLQGAEPLVGISKEFRVPVTNGPFFFDLITGNMVQSGGDLEITVTRSSGSLSKKTPGDWSIQLKPINGGIIESDHLTAQMTFEAPAEGYQESYFVKMNREDRAWFDSIDKEFFLKSRGGQVYSKLNFDFGINREPNSPMYFQFRGVANTNSSRNWEATVPR